MEISNISNALWFIVKFFAWVVAWVAITVSVIIAILVISAGAISFMILSILVISAGAISFMILSFIAFIGNGVLKLIFMTKFGIIRWVLFVNKFTLTVAIIVAKMVVFGIEDVDKICVSLGVRLHSISSFYVVCYCFSNQPFPQVFADSCGLARMDMSELKDIFRDTSFKDIFDKNCFPRKNLFMYAKTDYGWLFKHVNSCKQNPRVAIFATFAIICSIVYTVVTIAGILLGIGLLIFFSAVSIINNFVNIVSLMVVKKLVSTIVFVANKTCSTISRYFV